MKSVFRRLAAPLAVGLLALSSASQAGSFRAYISSLGNDSNPCTLALPCRLLPAAIAAINPGGEIWMLDSANFNTGTVTIDRSATILAIPGAVGSILANGGDAMQINGAGVKVSLRNLVFVNLSGAGNNGVSFINGASLSIHKSSFSNFPVAGLSVATGRVQVMESVFEGNATGVFVSNGLVTLTDNTFMNNNTAISASGNGGANVFPPNGTTRVRVSGGSILDNSTAFLMNNTGLRQSGACNGSNIFVRQDTKILMVGNTTYVNVIGVSDYNGGCTPPNQFTIDGFSPPL